MESAPAVRRQVAAANRAAGRNPASWKVSSAPCPTLGSGQNDAFPFASICQLRLHFSALAFVELHWQWQTGTRVTACVYAALRWGRSV